MYEERLGPDRFGGAPCVVGKRTPGGVMDT